MRDAWCPKPPRGTTPWAKVIGIELEEGRANELRRRSRFQVDIAIHSDAFHVRPHVDARNRGASVLFLNPPYDTDPDFGRLEHRWLHRFGPTLAVGGALLFLIPESAFKACSSLLARRFHDLDAWRLPSPDFEDFRQVLIRARRAPLNVMSEATAARLAELVELPAGEWPILGAEPIEPLEVLMGDGYALSLETLEYDRVGTERAFRPFEGQPVGVDAGIGDLIGREYPTALPPKPAHLALALAAGHFNGHQLRPNDQTPGFPAVLVKGRFRRKLVTIDEKADADGGLKSVTRIERPALEMTGLRLDTFAFFRPETGSEITAPKSVEEATAADVIARYSRAFEALMARQFPPMHDPLEPSHQFALPYLPRRPMRAQLHGIRSALKLLSLRRNPKFLSEVGTGKTTMALYVIAALAPRFNAFVTDSLRRVPGFAGARLPIVRRSLIVCPPHLLESWRDQARMVWPSARVIVVERIADLSKEADLYILSRETAKLGHGVRGVRNERCPKCGAPAPPEDECAAKRLHCRATFAEPENLSAVLARDLAEIVLPVAPFSEQARSLTARRRTMRLRADRPATPLDTAALERYCSMKLGPGLVKAIESDQSNSEERSAIGEACRILGALVPNPRQFATDLLLLSTARKAENQYCSWSFAERAAELAVAGSRAVTVSTTREKLVAALQQLMSVGRWSAPGAAKELEEGAEGAELPQCGEPLYQAVPEPRRFPIARYICRKMPRRFDLLVLDEAHEFNNLGTAQQKAAHRLAELGIPTLALTGSMMGGYASSLFANWWALDRAFREHFGRDDKPTFSKRYGFQKYLFTPIKKRGSGADEDGALLGAVTDRELAGWNCKTLGEVPGVLPLFLLRHLLPDGIVVHKSDLDRELPALTEEQNPLGPPPAALDAELRLEYKRLEKVLMEQIRNDAFTPLQGKLWGALSELPSYLDRATEDHGPFVIKYPEDVGGAVVATGRAFPREFITQKEAWLLETVRREIAGGNKVMVFLRHTGGGSPLAKRLQTLLMSQVTPRVVFLDASKVPTQKRERWIDEKVVAKGVEVLLVNPNAVRTGLNNLVAFNVGVWFEYDYSAQTYRQANGRLHRIGQERDVRILFPFFDGTAQQVALELIASKVSASLQVDGLTIQGALESAGADDDERAAIEAAMQMGEAIYRRLLRQAAPQPTAEEPK